MSDSKEALPVVAWLTKGTKDGRAVLKMAECTANEAYAKTHKTWDWKPLTDHATATALLSELRAEVERLRQELFKAGRMSEAPCFCCGYNGAGYFQPASHPCAAKHHRLFHGDDDAARTSASGEAG